MWLKRNVVVHVVKTTGRLGGGFASRCAGSRTGRRCRTASRCATTVIIATTTGGAHAFAAAEQLHFGGNDVDRVFLNTGLVGVFAVFQAAFDVNGAAFFDILAGNFSQAVIEGDAVPLSVFNRFARRAVFAAAGGGDADVGHGLAGGQVTNFGVAAAVADQNDFVDGCHVYFLEISCDEQMQLCLLAGRCFNGFHEPCNQKPDQGGQATNPK